LVERESDRSESNGVPAAGIAGGRRRIAASLAVVLVLLAAVVVRRRAAERPGGGSGKPYAVSFPVLGTYASLKFWTPERTAEAAASAIAADLYEIHRTLNLFDPESELSRLNRSAAEKPFRCSALMWKILCAARTAWKETNGAFDVTVGPLMELWGFHRKRSTLPTYAEIESVMAKVGFDKVIMDDSDRTVHFRRAGMRLDFGGIAKGFALDRCVRIAREHGVHCGLIDLGGNIFCLERPPPGRAAYEIGIRDPFDPDGICGTIRLVDGAVATSGNYEQYVVLDGKRFTHIVDPRSGRPVADVAAVTVVTPRGVDSDVFSTAIFVAGDPMIRALKTLHPESRVLRITAPASGPARVQGADWVWHRPPPAGWLSTPAARNRE